MTEPPDKPPTDPILEFNQRFLRSRQKQIEAWNKERPGYAPPVYKDRDGRYFWVNRKGRKRMAKDAAKAKREAKNKISARKQVPSDSDNRSGDKGSDK